MAGKPRRWPTWSAPPRPTEASRRPASTRSAPAIWPPPRVRAGRLEEAGARIATTRTVAATTGNAIARNRVQSSAAWLRLALGDPERARAEIRRPWEVESNRGIAYGVAGILYIGEVAAARLGGNPRYMALGEAVLGRCDLVASDPVRAQSHLHQALDLLADSGLVPATEDVLELIAAAAAGLGNHTTAARLTREYQSTIAASRVVFRLR